MRDANTGRFAGYVLVFTGLLWAAIAVDQLAFHSGRGVSWLVVALALGFLARGAWRLRPRHPK